MRFELKEHPHTRADGARRLDIPKPLALNLGQRDADLLPLFDAEFEKSPRGRLHWCAQMHRPPRATNTALAHIDGWRLAGGPEWGSALERP